MSRLPLLSLALAVLAALLMAGSAYSGDRSEIQARSTVSEQRAHEAVWGLPEVQASAGRLRERGVRPFTMTSSEPDHQAEPGTVGASYVIYFGEDHGTHATRVATFLVDAHTGRASASP